MTGKTPNHLVRRGVTQVPEGRQVFPSLPVEANLLLGAFGRSFRTEIVTSTIRYLRRRAEARERLERIYTLLPKLHELRDRPAGRTSGGEQQMVAIGRALMAEPRALAIDELSLGLAPLIVEQLVEFLHRLNDEEHVAILLVEQNALARVRPVRARVRPGDGAGRPRGPEQADSRPSGGAQRISGRRARMTEFLQLVVVGLSTGSAFALVGMSLVLVYRTTGIVNFAQGVFVVIGGLFTFRFSDDMPLALASLVSIVIAALLASILAVVAVGFRGRTTSLASMIITLGAAFLAEALLLLEFGDIPRSYRGISDHAWNVGGVLVQPQYVLIAGVALLSAVVLTLFLRWTIVGQALVACSDSRRAAELVGLNMRSLAVVAFVGAGALCALGGVAARAEQPHDVQLGRRDHRERLRGGRLRRARIDPSGPPRRVRARDPRAVRGRLRRSAVQPHHRPDRDARPDRMAFEGRDRSASHDAHAAIQRARVPWPAPVRIGLILAGAVFACWLPTSCRRSTWRSTTAWGCTRS